MSWRAQPLFLSPALVRELAAPAVVLGDNGVVLDVRGGVVVDLVVDHLQKSIAF